MRSKWVLHKLNTNTLSCSLTSILSPLKLQLQQHNLFPSPTSSKTTYVPTQNVDIKNLLSICGTEGYFHLGTSLHALLIKSPQTHSNEVAVWNSLLSMYAKSGALSDAVKLFDTMAVRDTISWNSLISAFFRVGEAGLGFGYFKKLQSSDLYRLDQASLTTVLSACDRPELGCFVRAVHCLVFVGGFEREITVGNALVTSYFKCGCSSSGRQVFDEMVVRNVITWTAVISGLAKCGTHVESLRLFLEMRHGSVEPNFLTYLSSLMACSGLQALRTGYQLHGLVWKLGIQSDLCIESALMDMYSKCGGMDCAWRIFESAKELDAIALTVILVGLAQNGFEEEAMEFFVKMVKAGIDIDANMVSAALGVFGSDADMSLGLGKQIHSLVVKRSFVSNTFVGNGLVNMYSKCGDLGESVKTFSQMPFKNSISWNSMIAAFARHGTAVKALELYEEMRLARVEPTDVTYLSLLHACGHVGLVDKGLEFLKSMIETDKLTPRTEHYSCIVDMLGRAGLLDEAKRVIEESPVKHDVAVWQALLGASSFHGDTKMGKYAADKLFLLEPEKPAPYILLANIYSSKGRWKERAQTIKKMNEKGVLKETAVSWIEMEKNVHSFVVEDKTHSQSKIMYRVLKELFKHMADEGYVPDKRFVLFNWDRDRMED